MQITSTRSRALALLAACAMPLAATVSAQEQPIDSSIDVYGQVPADLEGMPEGPKLEGFISARKGDQMQVTTVDGSKNVVAISTSTEIRSSGGFLGLSKEKLTNAQLLNGLPVTVETVQWGNGLVASKVALKSKDMKTAAMIHNGTDQRFTSNEAATEALRNRVADIDQYNVKGVTNVYFDTGKANLSGQAQSDLCGAAAQAGQTENALLLVVGYTDDVGDYDYNQELSEKRASRVVNYLQQQCGWKPFRMLTPTGMAEADPAADNSTPEGKAQNRRVSVNILVSKAVDDI